MNLFESESAIRLMAFAGVLLIMAVAETLEPRRARETGLRGLRWTSNLLLAVINVLAIRVVVPLGATGVAMAVAVRGYGILNLVSLPEWAAVVTAILVLDFVVYFQHWLFHKIPALWRLHMVHHADLEFDVTTGVRFHTVEILLSMVIKSATVAVIGAPPLAVLIFEIVLNATSMFNHANLRLPLWLDRVLRLIVVTPDMHRVHHSTLIRETNSNYGFNVPWWDYLFRTYCDQPAAGHEGMSIGLSEFRSRRVLRLHWMLALPFVPQRVRGTDPQFRSNEAERRLTQPTGAAADEALESGPASRLLGPSPIGPSAP